MYAAMIRADHRLRRARLDRLEALAVVTVPDARDRRRAGRARSCKPSRRMAEAIAGAELAVIPDAAHSPQFESARRLVGRVAGVPRASAAWRSAGLVEEALGLDDHPGDLAGGHEAAGVVDRDGEREPPALDPLEGGLGGDRGADRRRGEVVDLHAHADRGAGRRAPGRRRRRWPPPRTARSAAGWPAPAPRRSAWRRAVSASATISLALPCSPGPRGTWVRYAAPWPPGQGAGPPTEGARVARRRPDPADPRHGAAHRRRAGRALRRGPRPAPTPCSTTARSRTSSSGRERGAGIRVIVGRHHRLRPHRRPVRGRPGRGGRGSGGRRPLGRRRRARGGAHPARRSPRPNPIAVLPEDVAKARKVELLAPGRRRRPRRPASAITQVTARYGDSRRRILVANSDGLLTEDDQVRTLFTVMAVASGDTGMQTGYQTLGRTVGFELFDTYDVDRPRPGGGRAGPAQAGGPPGARRARCRW